MTGRDHIKYTIPVATLGLVASPALMYVWDSLFGYQYSSIEQTICVVFVFIGMFLIYPDLDVPTTTTAKHEFTRYFPYLGYPFQAFWHFYSTLLPHRSYLSHSYVISTLVRYVYIIVMVNYIIAITHFTLSAILVQIIIWGVTLILWDNRHIFSRRKRRNAKPKTWLGGMVFMFSSFVKLSGGGRSSIPRRNAQIIFMLFLLIIGTMVSDFQYYPQYSWMIIPFMVNDIVHTWCDNKEVI